ncbi:hypothetical protein PEPS_16820 [Persicobacter psychrovividus]|uniref:Uncharacterized protein n=1 Tax=Persicobacter psychrovividus TaxID=387638 RepID=A0ABM7VEM7_9BACT|nr:hypothetical protein PEPS_16820 [Persicobacter psychrovividus]
MDFNEATKIRFIIKKAPIMVNYQHIKYAHL